MNYLNTFLEVMENEKNLALASIGEGFPNVRIINFIYDQKEKKVYFSTFKDNQKVIEFNQNPKVAFTTIPENKTKHVRVNQGIVQKSSKTLDELASQFIAKTPDFKETIKQVGSFLDIYEIEFKKAMVIIDMKSHGEITL